MPRSLDTDLLPENLILTMNSARDLPQMEGTCFLASRHLQTGDNLENFGVIIGVMLWDKKIEK